MVRALDLPAAEHALEVMGKGIVSDCLLDIRLRPGRIAWRGVTYPESEVRMSAMPGLSDEKATSWRKMLEATPVRNAAAELAQEGPEGLSVSVKVKRPGYLVPPISWVIRRSPTRTVKLDRLGANVWSLCNGARTVEAVIDEFARVHRLSFHEARAAVTWYLSQLIQRGVLAIAVGDTPQ